MNHYTDLHYLCCMNMNCQVSIYHRMVLRIPFDAENPVKIHRCSFCNYQLVSENEIGLAYMVTKVNSQKNKKLSYQHN